MNFSQLSFGLFGLKIYGILFAIAFVVASWHYYKSIQKRNLSVDFFLRSFWKLVMGGVVVGRVFALLLDFGIFERNGIFSFFAFWDGEVHFLGALIGFIATLKWLCVKHKMEFLNWLDAGVFSFFLGILIMDIAGFLTGTVYGRETSLPWGIQYETFGVDILKPTHPVTLYAFFAHLVVFTWLKKHIYSLEKFSGGLALRAGILFFMVDIFLQFFRGDSTCMIFQFLRIEQIFDVVVLIFLLLWGKKNIAKI